MRLAMIFLVFSVSTLFAPAWAANISKFVELEKVDFDPQIASKGGTHVVTMELVSVGSSSKRIAVKFSHNDQLVAENFFEISRRTSDRALVVKAVFDPETKVLKSIEIPTSPWL